MMSWSPGRVEQALREIFTSDADFSIRALAARIFSVEEWNVTGSQRTSVHERALS